MTRCALYRHFDASGALLYIGISENPAVRLRQHFTASPWAGEIASVTLEYFETRDAAMIAEKASIRTERPRENQRNLAIVNGTASSVKALIDAWPKRADFASAVGAELQAVHKWAKFGSIPSGWQASVVIAAQGIGLAHVTAEWMLAQHSRLAA